MTAPLVFEWTPIDVVGKTVKIDIVNLPSRRIEFQNTSSRNPQNPGSLGILWMKIVLQESSNGEMMK